MLRAHRCPGSMTLVAVPARDLTADGGWGQAVCPVCGMVAEPIHSTVLKLKWTYWWRPWRSMEGVVPGRWFDKGTWVGKVRIHRRAPETHPDWSRG